MGLRRWLTGHLRVKDEAVRREEEEDPRDAMIRRLEECLAASVAETSRLCMHVEMLEGSNAAMTERHYKHLTVIQDRVHGLSDDIGVLRTNKSLQEAERVVDAAHDAANALKRCGSPEAAFAHAALAPLLVIGRPMRTHHADV
jgi:hypothetical protein